MVTRRPAIVTRPERAAPPFRSTDTSTDPLPEPLFRPLMAIQSALELAVQSHLLVVVTVMVKDSPDAAIDLLVGDRP